MSRRFWLMKTEPDTFSIDDLAAAPRRRTFWEGVRNYQARNLLRDEVREGDGVLVYHSGGDRPAAVGTARVAAPPAPDPSQFDRQSPYFDSGAERASPRWWGVEIELERVFRRPVTLNEMRSEPELAAMVVLRRGNRLSVSPVTGEEWRILLKLGT